MVHFLYLHKLLIPMNRYLMACACFRPGGISGLNSPAMQNCGVYVGVLIVCSVVVAATTVIIFRLNKDEKLQDGTETPQPVERFNFLIGYALELTVSLFIFYFITSTVFFTGILGCGRIPVFGGRPYELRKLKQNNRVPE